jgi:hypothetical protein
MRSERVYIKRLMYLSIKKIDVFSLYYKLDNQSFNESKNISFSNSKDKRE